jgi:hypothetical protein
MKPAREESVPLAAQLLNTAVLVNSALTLFSRA